MNKHEQAENLAITASVHTVVKIPCQCGETFVKTTGTICIAAYAAFGAGWRVNSAYEPHCPDCARKL